LNIGLKYCPIVTSQTLVRLGTVNSPSLLA